MGRLQGGYFGGCTVVGKHSGWFTGVHVRRPVKKVTSLTELRRQIIHGVIDAGLAGRPLPPLNGKMSAHFADKIKAAGGGLNWAKDQPEYREIYLKKLMKWRKRQVSGRQA